LIIEGIQRLLSEKSDFTVDLTAIIILVVSIATKLCLYLYCRFIASQTLTVQTLQNDHKNDVISNTFGTLCAFLGYQYWQPLDSIGAICIALYLIFNWSTIAKKSFKMMAGRAAPPEFQQKVTYLAMQHHKDICKIDTVRAFHFGNGFIVEVDIVLDANTPLKITHDIGESLQNKIESMNEVERAFVHIDYEFTHKPEHKKIF